MVRSWSFHDIAPLDAAALAADVVCDAISATAEDHWYGVSFESVLGELARRFAS